MSNDKPDGAPRPAAAGAPSDAWSEDETPLPGALPYHVADPSGPVERLPERELSDDDDDAETRPGAEPRTWPQLTGLANAARKISESLLGAGDRPAGEAERPARPRVAPAGAASHLAPEGDDDGAEPSPPHVGDEDDELTQPR